MEETYCIKDKRVTPCVEPSGFQSDKNGRKQFYCHCAICGIKKVRYVKSNGLGKKSLIKQQGQGIATDIGGVAADTLIYYGVPWLAKKTVEMGRYGASELMRNKKLQKKAINYGINKLTPFIQDSVGTALDELSTKVRPDIKYKTDGPELDGKGIDINKWIGKLPRPKAGFTPGKYKYMGAYNPLEKQLEYDPETGEVLKWKVMPYNKVDEISAYHDICYDMGKNKGECDKEMVKSLDKIPYGEMPKWGTTARFLVNTKQKLGLGLNSKPSKTSNGVEQ